MTRFKAALGSLGLLGGGYKGLRSIKSGRPLIGEPVDGVTGEVCLRKLDFVLPAELELKLERMYASGLEHESCFGPRWCSTWGQHVKQIADSAVFYPDDGRSIPFESVDAQWHGNPHVNRIRIRRYQPGFEVRDENRLVLRFEFNQGDRWLLSGMEDPNGNSIRFQYDNAGALRLVVHSGGYTLRVDGTPNRIWRVALVMEDGSLEELIRYEYL